MTFAIHPTATDECQSGDSNCDVNAVCEDIPEGFVCTCREGYSGSGAEGDCTGMAKPTVCSMEYFKCTDYDCNAFSTVQISMSVILALMTVQRMSSARTQMAASHVKHPHPYLSCLAPLLSLALVHPNQLSPNHLSLNHLSLNQVSLRPQNVSQFGINSVTNTDVWWLAMALVSALIIHYFS